MLLNWILISRFLSVFLFGETEICVGIVGVNAKLKDERFMYYFGCNISEIKRLSCKESLPLSVETDIQTIKKRFNP